MLNRKRILRWRWGVYRRIGVHLYRCRKLYRNYQGRYRAYCSWESSTRIGRHLYRLRILKRWDGGRDG